MKEPALASITRITAADVFIRDVFIPSIVANASLQPPGKQSHLCRLSLREAQR
jgi:hypothetical protein